MLGLESGGLELDGDEAIQPAMEEEEVEREILPADLDGILGADKAEIAAQLGEESAQVAEQCPVQVGLGMGIGEAEEFQRVGILENVHCLRMQFSHQR